MRNLILLIAILITGLVSAQAPTLTVSGTTYEITGSQLLTEAYLIAQLNDCSQTDWSHWTTIVNNQGTLLSNASVSQSTIADTAGQTNALLANLNDPNIFNNLSNYQTVVFWHFASNAAARTNWSTIAASIPTEGRPAALQTLIDARQAQADAIYQVRTDAIALFSRINEIRQQAVDSQLLAADLACIADTTEDAYLDGYYDCQDGNPNRFGG